MSHNPFEELLVLGAMPADAAAAKLRELDEEQAAFALEHQAQMELERSSGVFGMWPFQDRAWQHTAHTFGFLPEKRTSDPAAIRSIGEIEGDRSLKDSRVKIALNRLRVADYPGRGTHRILLDFYARNQVSGSVEDIHFNATYRVREGERAPVAGYPIFVGLNVGSDGVALRCHTINVQNDVDESFLAVLESDVFRSGLRLATTAQPAIAPFATLALGLTKSVAQRRRNVSVQDFYLGLDFGGTAMGARLAVGDYIAVQIPEAFSRVWSWNDWVYDSASGTIVSKEDPDTLIPYNYLVFGVSRYEGD
jgi:hypothetical protein